MSETQLKEEEEDVMTMLSVSDEYDITHEEEITLLEVDEHIDNNTNHGSVRQKIVFDMNDSNCDNEDNDSNHMRYKFRNERNQRHSNGDTICMSLNQSNRSQIPDSLDSVNIRDSKKQLYPKGRSGKNRRKRNRWSASLEQTDGLNNRCNDLREIIGRNRFNSNLNNRSLINRLNSNNFSFNKSIPNEGLDFSQLNTLLTLQSLMNANPNLIQNSLLNPNSLFALSLNQTNQLHNNYTQIESSILAPNNTFSNNNVKKVKEDLTITIVNTPKQSSSKTSVNTLPKIRCIVKNDGLENTKSVHSSQNSRESTELSEIESQNTPQLVLKTKFAKHLSKNVNQSKQKAENTKSGDSFTEALAEAEAGVDNEYLRKMEEIKKQRLELQKRKEERRYEMADQRLQNANDLQQKLKNKRSVARQKPYLNRFSIY